MLPLLPQLVCAVAEKVSSHLLAMDPAAKPRLGKLCGKQLSFKLKEWPLTIVLSASQDALLFNQHDNAVDCAISTDLASLRLLRDPSQLTRLIKADALQIDGDIQVAQQYSSFFAKLSPDWQQSLSGYIGDAAAHKVSHSLQALQQYLQQKIALLQQQAVELAQDELMLSPTSIEMAAFSADVSALSARIDVVQQQLQKLREL